MRRPICAKCQIEFRVLKNGVWVIDMAWKPPKPCEIWRADLFECPICKAQIVGGFAQEPLAENYQDSFGYWLRKAIEGTHVYNYEHPEDANPTKNEVVQQLIEAISRHEPMANDPAIIDAINAIDDALCQRSE